MSQEASSYVTRHVDGIGAARRAVLYMLADLSNRWGRTRVTQGTIARRLGLCRRQIERHVRGMKAINAVRREGRTWVIVGVAGHDIATCPHEWCARQHARRTRPAAVARLGGWVRRKAATMAPARPHGDQGDPGTRLPSERHETGPRPASWRSKFKRKGRPS